MEAVFEHGSQPDTHGSRGKSYFKILKIKKCFFHLHSWVLAWTRSRGAKILRVSVIAVCLAEPEAGNSCESLSHQIASQLWALLVVSVSWWGGNVVERNIWRQVKWFIGSDSTVCVWSVVAVFNIKTRSEYMKQTCITLLLPVEEEIGKTPFMGWVLLCQNWSASELCLWVSLWLEGGQIQPSGS